VIRLRAARVGFDRDRLDRPVVGTLREIPAEI
jgi:hypothetical protein